MPVARLRKRLAKLGSKEGRGGKGGNGNQSKDKFQDVGHYVHADAWKLLSPKVQQQMLASRKARRAGGSYNRYKPRKVSVVKMGSNSAPMEDDEPDNDVETSKVTQPGRRFGRKATISAVRTSKHYFGSRLIGKVEVMQRQ